MGSRIKTNFYSYRSISNVRVRMFVCSHVREESNVRMFDVHLFAKVRMFRCSNVRMFANVWMFVCSNVQSVFFEIINVQCSNVR